MNRKIKFRGKRIDNGEWVYGYLAEKYFYADKKYVILTEYADARNFIEYEVIPETICQFTGIFDYTDYEVYEDDIIQHFDGRIGKVVWNKAYGRFDIAIKNKSDTINSFRVSGLGRYDVIGNVHDNPEYVKEYYYIET